MAVPNNSGSSQYYSPNSKKQQRKVKIQDWGSTGVGVLVFGFLALMGVTEDQVMNLYFAVMNIVNSVELDNLTVGGVLAFFLYDYKRGK